jgi:ABC-type nickel/cobalt efflux system permease component RcnA
LLLRQAWSARRSGGHDHAHGHEHPHDDHAGAHDHVDGHDSSHHPRGLSWRSLVAPGLAGGLVPSPSALVVLLGGIALGRAWFGVTLVIAYGVGMAAALVGAGYLLVRARERMTRRVAGHRPGRLVRLGQVLPLVTAALVTTGGLVLAARAMAGA